MIKRTALIIATCISASPSSAFAASDADLSAAAASSRSVSASLSAQPGLARSGALGTGEIDRLLFGKTAIDRYTALRGLKESGLGNLVTGARAIAEKVLNKIVHEDNFGLDYAKALNAALPGTMGMETDTVEGITPQDTDAFRSLAYIDRCYQKALADLKAEGNALTTEDETGRIGSQLRHRGALSSGSGACTTDGNDTTPGAASTGSRGSICGQRAWVVGGWVGYGIAWGTPRLLNGGLFLVDFTLRSAWSIGEFIVVGMYNVGQGVVDECRAQRAQAAVARAAAVLPAAAAVAARPLLLPVPALPALAPAAAAVPLPLPMPALPAHAPAAAAVPLPLPVPALPALAPAAAAGGVAVVGQQPAPPAVATPPAVRTFGDLVAAIAAAGQQQPPVVQQAGPQILAQATVKGKGFRVVRGPNGSTSLKLF